MRPLGVLSHWNYTSKVFLSDVLKCWEAIIDFLMIFGDFGVFSLMVTDGRTDIRTYGLTDIRTDGHTDGQTLIQRCEGASKNKADRVQTSDAFWRSDGVVCH